MFATASLPGPAADADPTGRREAASPMANAITPRPRHGRNDVRETAMP
jgi:hypothetical protein